MDSQYVFIEWLIPNRGFCNNEPVTCKVPSRSSDKPCLWHAHQHCRWLKLSGVNHNLTIRSPNNLHKRKYLQKEILFLFCSGKLKHEKWISYIRSYIKSVLEWEVNTKLLVSCFRKTIALIMPFPPLLSQSKVLQNCSNCIFKSSYKSRFFNSFPAIYKILYMPWWATALTKTVPILSRPDKKGQKSKTSSFSIHSIPMLSGKSLLSGPY